MMVVEALAVPAPPGKLVLMEFVSFSVCQTASGGIVVMTVVEVLAELVRLGSVVSMASVLVHPIVLEETAGMMVVEVPVDFVQASMINVFLEFVLVSEVVRAKHVEIMGVASLAEPVLPGNSVRLLESVLAVF